MRKFIFLIFFTFLFFATDVLLQPVHAQSCVSDNPSCATCFMKAGDHDTQYCAADCGADSIACDAPNVGRVCYFSCLACNNSGVCCFPKPTPTPTQPGSPVCEGMSTTSSSPALGDSISMTCIKNASYTSSVTYRFVLVHKTNANSPDPNPLPTPFVQGTSNTAAYTFPAAQYGYYRFMCQICNSSGLCSGWQSPGLPPPTLIPTSAPQPTLPPPFVTMNSDSNASCVDVCARDKYKIGDNRAFCVSVGTDADASNGYAMKYLVDTSDQGPGSACGEYSLVNTPPTLCRAVMQPSASGIVCAPFGTNGTNCKCRYY